ncbi:hypothetical protein H5410_056648 [Solanum commersonii]|uniref:Uncharacterized protein n=1 Tax=Solanum commersonii TaxID=4109 RepID=A0A9J5WLX3_SOLCO|nr:hypothetical protein H5410_056648 [Solanum commersonii]
MILGVIFWCLWTERNKRCFDGISTSRNLLRGCLVSLFSWSKLTPVNNLELFLDFEREERIQRLKRQHPDDRPAYPSQLRMRDEIFQTKRQKPSSRLPPGWLDCPAFGQEIGCIIPSKVPLDETFNDCVLPGKRYSFRQVLHQQRVLGRKLGMVIDLTNTSRYYSLSDWRKEGIKHVKVGNGNKTKFWKDGWIDQTSLRELFLDLFLICENPDARVSDCWTEHGWDISLRRLLSDWEVERVAALLEKLAGMIITTTAIDKILWKHNKDGVFSVNNAYKRGPMGTTGAPKYNWNYFWKSDIPT